MHLSVNQNSNNKIESGVGFKPTHPLWFGLALSALSGILLTASMPGFNVPFIGWIALVPLLVVLIPTQPKKVYLVALPFGIIFSIGVHNWYPNIFTPALGYFLIIAVGTFYAGILNLGVWLYSRLPEALKIIALPVSWSAVEFVKYIAPVVQDWWFVLLANSQWRFPPALQILSITGFPGLSFMVMLVNVAIASFIIYWKRSKGSFETRSYTPGVIALIISVLVVIIGAASIPQPENQFKVAVVTDMVYSLPVMQGKGNFAGSLIKTPEISQALLDNDAELTRQAAQEKPAFVVWSENGFANIDDPLFMKQLSLLAGEVNSTMAVNTNWKAPTGKFNTALLVGPNGIEIGRRAKINVLSQEISDGFSAGPLTFPVFDTAYGKAGIAVCWDVHRLWIIRELARSGAQIILLPMDNDFLGIPTFPPFHAADAVFRAAENHLTFGLGTVNGLSMVIDPYGRITAEGRVNRRGVTVGPTFVTNNRTIYTLFGDWFGWTMVAGLCSLIVLSFKKKK